jgi:hypothetical protein
MAAYYDFYRKIRLVPDSSESLTSVTLEADSVQDTLTITGGSGVALNPNASSDSFTIDVDYQLYVPIGTTNIRLQDVNTGFTGVALTPGSNIAITRTSNNELTITATVGAASKSISNISQTNPIIITTTNAHEFTEGTAVTITDVIGMTELNGNEYYMNILTGNTFALYDSEFLTTPIDGTGFTPYSTGGVATADYSSVKTLSGLSDVDTASAQPNDILVYKFGTWTPTKEIEANMVGSVFGDDSTTLVDGLTNTHYGTFVGDLIGNTIGTVSSIGNHTTSDLAEGTRLYYTDVRADARIAAASITDLSDADQGVATTDSPNFVTVTANLTGNVTGDLTGSTIGHHTGDVKGSVFADDSTLLVDGVSATINLTNNSTSNLAEGTNLYYTDARVDARIVFAGSANWNTAYSWGNHATVGYHIAGTPHDGDVTGSVFADDSTLLVDGVTGFINLINNTTSDLAEGTNLYYTDQRAQNATIGRSIAMSLIFGG